MSYQKESATARLQQDLKELKKRVHEYRTHLVHVEEMFEETQVNIKRFRSKAEQQFKIVQRDAAREAKIMSHLTEMSKELEKLKEKNSTPLRNAEEMPDAVKSAAKHTVAYKVMRYVKIGCILVLDSLATYTLFNITRPCFL